MSVTQGIIQVISIGSLVVVLVPLFWRIERSLMNISKNFSLFKHIDKTKEY
jgi:hypothetical protein